MKLKIIQQIMLLMLLLAVLLSSSCYATSLNDVCHNFWDGTAIATPPSLSPWQVQDGLDIPIPLNIWCSWRRYGESFPDESSTLMMTMVQMDNYYSDFSITDHQNSGDSIPVDWCIGKPGFDGLCFNHSGAYMSMSGNSTASLLPELFQYDTASSDPCGKGSNDPICQNDPRTYQYQLMSYLELHPYDEDSPVAPGRYVGTFSIPNITLNIPTNSHYGFPIIYANSTGISEKIVVTIRDSCHIEAPEIIDLGSAPFPQQLSSGVENLKVQCTEGTPYKITFQGSQDSNTSEHRLEANHAYIPYRLYNNSAYFHDIIGKKGIRGEGTGEVETIPIGVKVDKHAVAVPAGIYKDTVTVTLSY